MGIFEIADNEKPPEGGLSHMLSSLLQRHRSSERAVCPVPVNVVIAVGEHRAAAHCRHTGAVAGDFAAESGSKFRELAAPRRPLRVDGTAVEVIQAPKLEPRIARYELSDYERAAIKPMLPNKLRGVPRVNDRRVLNGIFWVLRSGAPWRDLPETYGPRTTCYNRFVRWRRAGVWDQIIDALAAGHDTAVQMIDTSIVRVHQHGACVTDNNHQDTDRSRGALTSKIHAVVDTNGPQSVRVSAMSMVRIFRRLATLTVQQPQLDHVSFPCRSCSTAKTLEGCY
jgi:transposase